LEEKDNMSEEPLNRVITALQEYNEYLGGLVSKLNNIIEKLNELDGTQEWGGKIEKAEERLCAIEAKLSKFVDQFSLQASSIDSCAPSMSAPALIRCKNWEDFKTQSTNARLVSFLFQKEEGTVQVYSLKEGRILIYIGEFPQQTKLLRSWLSSELGTPGEKVVEGVLATG
jgi:hypothetical protein